MIDLKGFKERISRYGNAGEKAQLKKGILYMIAMSLYAFVYSKSYELITAAAEGDVGIFNMIAGMVGLAALIYCPVKKQERFKHLDSVIMCMSFLLFVFIHTPVFEWMSVTHKWLLIAFCIGFTGAGVFCAFSMALGSYSHLGLAVLLAQSLALALQMLTDAAPIGEGYMWIVISVLLGLLVVFLIYSHSDSFDIFDEPADKIKEGLPVHAIFFIIILADIFSVAVQQYWLLAWEVGNADMYTYPRLFMILGYVVAAISFELFGGRYKDILMPIMLTVGFLGVSATDFLLLRMSFFYILAGYFVLYVNIRCFGMARRSPVPYLVAAMGKVILLPEALASVIISSFFDNNRFAGLIIMVACIVLVFLILMLNEKRHPDFGEYREPTPSASDPMDDFCGLYSLTPREGDVVDRLLKNDDSMKIIAEDLSISERMLYRYMKKLYEKTGAENRAGIVRAYYEAQK